MAERPHHRLLAWQKALDLVQRIYLLGNRLPIEERFGLASQMKRASVSIASNLAEGAARSSNAEKLHFYYLARGSLSEIETQLRICVRLGFLTSQAFQEVQILADTVSALLQGLIESRRQKVSDKSS